MQPATSNESKIAREAGLSFGWNVLGSVLRFLFGILVARIYSVEWLGLFAISSSIVRITSDAGNLGIDQGLVRYVSRLRELGRPATLVATVHRALRLGCIGGLTVGLLVFWSSGPIGRAILETRQDSLAWMIAAFAAAIPLMTIAQILGAASQGLKDLKRRALALDVFPPLVLCLVLVLLHDRVSASWAIALSFWASQVVSLLAAYGFLRRFIPLGRSAGAAPEPGLLSFSLPLLSGSVVSNLMRWGDVILLGWFTDASVTGLYQLAARIAAVISMVTTSVAGIFAPIVSGFHAKGQTGDIRRLLRLVTRWCFTVSWMSFAFLVVYAAQVLAALGEQFRPASDALVLLAAAHVFWSLGAPNMMLLTMTGYPKLNMLNMVLTLLVNVAANLYLIPRLGASGAALALTLSFAAWALLQTIEVSHLHKMIQLSRLHLKPLLAGALALLASLPIRRVVADWGAWPGLLAALASFTLLYAGLLYLLRVEAEDRDALAALFSRSSVGQAAD